MALIKCPECGKEVSSKANVCIHCGYPLGEIQDKTATGDYNLIFRNCGPNKVKALKKIQEVLNCDITKAMKIRDSAKEVVLLTSRDKEWLDRIKNEFSDIQSDVYIAEYSANPQLKERTLVCPHCGSSQIVTGQRGYSLITGFVGSNKTVNRCQKCGWSWSPR